MTQLSSASCDWTPRRSSGRSRRWSREGSFEAAARSLHVTPSAVSQRIKALEQTVGQVLVQPRPKPCRATDAGRPLLRLAGQVALLEREALDAARGPPAGGRAAHPGRRSWSTRTRWPPGSSPRWPRLPQPSRRSPSTCARGRPGPHRRAAPRRFGDGGGRPPSGRPCRAAGCCGSAAVRYRRVGRARIRRAATSPTDSPQAALASAADDGRSTARTGSSTGSPARSPGDGSTRRSTTSRPCDGVQRGDPARAGLGHGPGADRPAPTSPPVAVSTSRRAVTWTSRCTGSTGGVDSDRPGRA